MLTYFYPFLDHNNKEERYITACVKSGTFKLRPRGFQSIRIFWCTKQKSETGLGEKPGWIEALKVWTSTLLL